MSGGGALDLVDFGQFAQDLLDLTLSEAPQGVPPAVTPGEHCKLSNAARRARRRAAARHCSLTYVDMYQGMQLIRHGAGSSRPMAADGMPQTCATPRLVAGRHQKLRCGDGAATFPHELCTGRVRWQNYRQCRDDSAEHSGSGGGGSAR